MKCLKLCLKLGVIIGFLAFPLSNTQGSVNLFNCGRSSRRVNFVPRIPPMYFNVKKIKQTVGSRNSIITTAPQDILFVTVFQNNRRNRCLGTVQAIELCYNAKSLMDSSSLSLYLVDNAWTISKENTTVTIVPHNDNCMRIRGKGGWVCCEIIKGFDLHVTRKHIGFGVLVSGGNTEPYRFDSSETTYLVQEYEWNITEEEEFSSNDGNDGQLLLLRLSIADSNLDSTSSEPLLEIVNNETHSVLPSTSLMPGVISSHVSTIAGATVGALIVLCLIVIIVILIVGVHFMNKNKKQKRQMALNLTAYSATKEEDVEYADIGPEVCNKNNAYTSTMESYLANPYEVPKVSGTKETADEIYDLYTEPAFEETAIYAQLEDCGAHQLCEENIKLEEILGSGQFGEVYRGSCQGNDNKMEVAVKTLKKGASEEDRVKFLQEAAIMGQFKHPNVVTMYGIISDNNSVLIVLELLIKGDLRNHLLKSRPGEKGMEIDDHTLLSYCRQIACGMTYLSNKAFVHRDLAARNILVSDDEVCKISDFGMSRDLMYENYYVSHGGMIPVKWTAPEALHYKKYSTASDVWSYGILMYEIWSLGLKPYADIGNAEVMKTVQKGIRLQPPTGCSKHMYSIMIDCWNIDPTGRPSFIDLSRQLSLPDSKLLYWDNSDRLLNSQVTKLGAELKFSRDLYKDLQKRYL